MVAAWARQLSRGAKKFFGRQLVQGFQKFGRQLHGGVKLLPGAFKDTSKVYSNLERQTKGVPIVSNMFGFGAKGTGAIGSLLSGNLGQAIQQGKGAVGQGKTVLAQGTDAAVKLAPYVAMFA